MILLGVQSEGNIAGKVLRLSLKIGQLLTMSTGLKFVTLYVYMQYGDIFNFSHSFHLLSGLYLSCCRTPNCLHFH